MGGEEMVMVEGDCFRIIGVFVGFGQGGGSMGGMPTTRGVGVVVDIIHLLQVTTF